MKVVIRRFDCCHLNRAERKANGAAVVRADFHEKCSAFIGTDGMYERKCRLERADAAEWKRLSTSQTILS